jgi:hypothetical protein
VIVFALIMSLVALLVGGVSLFTVKNYLLAGTWQNLAGWGTLLFFIGVPVFALVTWFIRRMMKLKNHNPYLRTVFLSLFIFGSICAFALASMLGNDLKDEGFVKVENSLAQPNGGKLIVKSDLRKNRMHFKMGMLQFGDMRVAKDSALFDAVGVRIFKSPDSNFHLYQAKFSRGENYEAAEKNAQTINHGYAQIDSVLRIDNYFTIARGAKWRGQEVVAVIEVPVGKKIRIEKSIDRLKWHSFRVNNEYDEEEVFSRWYDNSDWESGVDMVMQANGKLKRVDGEMTEEEKEQKDELKELKRQDQGGDDYRYNQPKDTIRQIKKGDTTLIITNSAKTKQSKPALLPLPAVTLFPFLR